MEGFCSIFFNLLSCWSWKRVGSVIMLKWSWWWKSDDACCEPRLLQVPVIPWSLTVCLSPTVWCCIMGYIKRWWWDTPEGPEPASTVASRSMIELCSFSVTVRFLSRTKPLSTTCAGSTLKITSTSCRRSAPTTCRASPRAWTPSTLEMTGERCCCCSSSSSICLLLLVHANVSTNPTAGSSPVFPGLFEFCSRYTGASLQGATQLNHKVSRPLFSITGFVMNRHSWTPLVTDIQLHLGIIHRVRL